MKYIGYHRTSTAEQHLDRGLHEIESYCKENNFNLKKIYTDKKTGVNFERPRYTVMKEDVLECGDVLIITELDRLGRNKKDTINELNYFKEKGIRVMILEIPTTLINLDTFNNEMAGMLLETINNMLIEMYASLAQAENEKRKKRQLEGIEQMKKRGEWNRYGRPKFMEDEQFAKEYQNIIEGKEKPTELMKRLNMKATTYYKYRENYLKNNGIVKVVQYIKVNK